LARKGFAGVHARNARDKTSLHVAAAGGLTEVCEALLEQQDFCLSCAGDEQLLNIPGSIDIGIWLRFFESRGHVDSGQSVLPLVAVIAEDEESLNMPRSTNVGTWLRFGSKSHVCRECD